MEEERLFDRELVAERRYKWVAGHDPDGSPIYFTCGEQMWKKLSAARKRRAKKLAKDTADLRLTED